MKPYPVFLAILAAACSAPRTNMCSTGLIGTVDSTQARIRWFERTPSDTSGSRIADSVKIVDVALECIPNTNGGSQSASDSTRRRLTYDITVTTTVISHVVDTAYFKAHQPPPTAQIEFDALSRRGVVLGSATGVFSPDAQVTRSRVSATIGDLSPEVASRVTTVQAYWLYSK
jgi:hypothetical protein